MSQPTPYLRQYAFVDWSASYPTTPHSGLHMDTEFNAVKTTMDQVLVNMAVLQRDDGKLHNKLVGVDALDDDVFTLLGDWNPRGAWLTATAYAVKDFITTTGKTYVCLVAHTSGVFATDLAAGKWMLFASSGIQPDGTTTIIANIPFAGFRITGLGDAVGAQDAVTLTQVTAAIAAVTVTAASITETKAGTNTAKFVTADGLAALWQKGSDIVAATTLVKPADASLGGYHVITGSTTITAIWAGVTDGEEIEFRLTGSPSFTHSATLVMKDAATFQGAVGDVLRFRYEVTGTLWREVSRQRPDVRFSAHKNAANQTGIVSNTPTKMTATTEVYDIGSCYDAANSKFTPLAGYYAFSVGAAFSAGIADQILCEVYLYKNGSAASVFRAGVNASGTAAVPVYLNVELLANGTDFFEVYVNATSGGAGNKTVDGGLGVTWFQARRVS